MSCALNIDATVAEVTAMSAKHAAAISAIEPLLPRGTHVVFMNAKDAATMAQAYGSRILNGTVKCVPWTSRRDI